MKKFHILLLIGVLGLGATASGFLPSDGPQSDERTSYYAGGQAKESATWIDGAREGECSRWHRNGQLKARGSFEDGRMQGEWEWFLEDGSPDASRSGHYESGRLLR